MQREEIPNNTPSQVREYIREAIAIADEYTREDGEWEPIFREAVRMIAGKQIVMTQAPPLMLGTPGVSPHLHGAGGGRR